MKFQRKFIITYISISLISFVITFYLLYKHSVAEIEKNQIDLMFQLNEEIIKNINFIISDIDRISFLHIIDEKFRNILSKDYKQNNNEYINDLDYIRSVIRYSVRLNQFILGVTFIGKNGNVYTNTDRTNTSLKKIYKLLNKIKKADKNRIITSVYDGYFLQHKHKLISIIRIMVNPYNLKKVGYVIIDIDFKILKNLLISSESKSNIIGSLIIQNNTILFNSMGKKLSFGTNTTRKLTNFFNKGKGHKISYNIIIGGKEYLFVGSYIDIINCVLVHYVKKDNLSVDLNEVIVNYLLIMVPIFFFSILFILYFSIQLIKPINNLSKQMSVRKDFKYYTIKAIKDEENRKDEIGILIKSYNQLITRLKTSIRKEYLLKMNQKRIEIMMLQAQINPHFIYNTLNLINSIGELEDIDNICRITNCLSDILRYNIKKGNIVNFMDEIKMVKKYIYIQKLRFPGKIKAIYDIDNSLSKHSIMKFLIQPLVENSISHGLERKKGKGTLVISIKRLNEVIKVIIKDDGVGIDKERLIQIQHSLKIHSIKLVDKIGLGIKNVHFRIQDYYGDKYGLTIRSEINNGTIIDFTIPYKLKE